MKTPSLIFVVGALLGLGACGGTSSHPDAAEKPQDLAVTIEDLSVPRDFSVKPTADASEPKGDGATTTPLSAACMNICQCFLKKTEQTKCQSLCVSDDSRFQGFYFSGSGSGSGSGSSSSLTSSMYIARYSGSLSGMFAGKSSLSSGEPVVPTAACLMCLAQATCNDLENVPCQNDCPYDF